ncbi:MAG: pilus assembly protein PilM [Candidatus Nealsonbacteria bacterium]|nr:pilus assembly protein PilM [Candidatus Nealsonbacteria bacterium]
MLEFLSLKQEVFGLDISDRSLKIAKLKKRGEFLSLASFGETEIKSAGIIKQGEIKKEALFIKILKQALNDVKGEKLKTKYLIASLPEEKTLLQVIKIPLINKEELKSAVIYEAQNHIPLPIEDVYLDFQIIPPFFNKQDYYEALIVALPKKIVDPYVSCFKKAGLFPKALEIEPQAIVRALIKVKEDKSSSSAEPDDRKVRREKRTEFSSNPFAAAREGDLSCLNLVNQ